MKKFMIWSIIFLSFIGVCVIFCFTIFALNSVSLDYRSSSYFYNDETLQEILDAGEFSNGSCVFFIDKEFSRKKIELAHPYVKVINIETIFPNKLIVHCIEREELFAINFEDNKYYICDEDLKILRITQNENDDFNIQNSPIIIDGCGEINKDLNISDFLNLDSDMEEVIKKVSSAFKLNNRTCVEQKSIIKNIKLLMSASIKHYDYTVALKITDFFNFETTIIDASDFLELKINLFLTVNSEILDIDKLNSELIIYQTLSGNFVAHKLIKS